jgi:hypothetical protein
MALSKRMMALSAAVVGTGAAVVAPAAPASAHSVTIRTSGGSTATVGPAHSGIEVCARSPYWTWAYAQVKGPLVATDVTDTYGDGCTSQVIRGGIDVFRLCHTNDSSGTGNTCTGWKTVT